MTDDITSGEAAPADPPAAQDASQSEAAPAPAPAPAPGGGNEKYRVLKALSHRYEQNVLMIVVVAGDVQVPNPGIQPVLRTSHSALPAPDVLLLELELFQKPGHWPQVMAWVPIEYGAVFMLTGTVLPPPAQVKIVNAQLGDFTLPLTPV